MNKVSVIVPVYNAGKYLMQCLDSIINQSYRNLEIIIVDDGSTDGSGGICDGYAERDGRIRVLHCENAGVPTARNRALDLASGDWISFVDADDYQEKNLYEACIGKLEDSKADILMFENDIIGGRKKEKAQRDFIICGDENLKKLQAYALANAKAKEWGIKAPAFLWDKIYSRRLVETHHIRFPARAYGQDDRLFNIWCLGFARSFQYAGEVLYHYRILNTSLSHGYVRNRMEWDEALYRAILHMKNVEGFRRSDSYMEALYGAVVQNLWDACSRCFFHPDNERPVKGQIQYVREVLAREPYKTALKASRYKYLRIGGRLVKICRFRRAECMYFLYRLKEFIKRNRRRAFGDG